MVTTVKTYGIKVLLAAALTVPMLVAAAPVLAATGTISIYANTAFLIEQRTSNITGPLHVPNDVVGVYTATFPNLSNSSGSLTALLGGTNVGPDNTCTTSFVTTVVNGVCQVSVNDNTTGGVQCSHGGIVVNPKTCDFSVGIDENAPTGGVGH